MSESKKILYAVELEDDFEALVKETVDAAKGSGAKVVLYHALKTVVGALNAGSCYVPGQALFDLEEEILEEATIKLKKLATIVGVSEEDLIIEVEGDPRRAILNKAEELKVDAIFLNGHKHNLIGRLGSTADAIIHRSKCSVMVVRENKYV
jgi:nucleotide-binding universal stress UspA family protein